MKDKLLKFLKTYSVIYVAMILGFILLLVICAALPKTNKMVNRFRKSAVTLEMSGGDYSDPGGVTMDTYTDTLFLNISFNYDQLPPWKSAMMNNYRAVTYNCRSPQVESLRMQTQKRSEGSAPEPKYRNENYWRYWYGQCAILRILHYFWPIRQIYGALAVLVLFLFVTACCLTARKLGIFHAVALFSLLALCNIQFATFSLMFHSVFVIGLAGLIWLLLKKGEPAPSGPLFFIMGMLCAYFDAFSAPLLSLGIPALIFCGYETDCLDKNGLLTWKNWSRIWIWYPAVWLGGYILSWGTKILIGGFTAGSFSDAVNAFTQRIGSENAYAGLQFSRWAALAKNWKTFSDISGLFFYFLCIVFGCLLAIRVWQLKKGICSFDCKRFAGYLFLGLIPVCYMLATANHIFIHHWMTYRNLPISVIAVFMMLTAFRRKEAGGISAR